MAVHKLRIQEPNKAPREIDLEPGLTIGRAPTNRCVLDDTSASSQHARIVEIDGALAIQDVGSANKTRVDGGPALAKDQHARLVPGMRITIGGTKLEVVGDDDEDAGATMQRAKPAAADDTDMRTMVKAKRAPDPAPKAAVGDGEEATLVRRAPSGTAPKVDPAPKVAPAPRPPAPSPAAPARGSPPPAKPAVPVPAVLESAEMQAADLAPDDAERTAAVGSPDLEPALMQATLGEAKPRLVFRAKKQGFVVPVTETSNVLGRKQVGDVTIALDDDGVSSRHARLTLTGRSFWIEDLGSKNHTLLDKEQIAPRVKRVLHGDCCMRFGTIDVLFVVEPVAGMESPDGATYDEAVGFLTESGVLAGESLKRARDARREGKHPAQDLIVAGVISVAQWHDAITTAKLRVRANVPSRRQGSKQTLIVGVLVVVVLILVAVVVWLAKSGK